MRRVWLAFVLAAACAEPAFAQSDSARIAALEAKVDTLMRVIGDFRQRPDVSVPCVELPNGECPVLYRQRQLGLAADAAYGSTLPGFQAQISGIATRLAAVELQSGIANGIATFGTAVINRLSVGAPYDVTKYQKVQIHGAGDAEILFSANESGTNPQGAAKHQHVIGAQADGGLRIIFNWLCDSSGCHWVESSKPRRILAFDSQGTLSFSDDVNEVIDNSQTWVLLLDRANKAANFQLMKAGWHWELGTSTCTNCFDKKYIVPQQ